MEWSFDISFTKEEMDTLEKSWLEFLNEERPIYYTTNGSDWNIIGIENSRSSWSKAKQEATVVQYEDMEDNSL